MKNETQAENQALAGLAGSNPTAAPASAPCRAECWTDGACSGNPGPGGWSVLLRANGQEREFFGGEADSTNNIMELFAVLFCLETFGKSKSMTSGSSLVIRTDSQYVQKGATEWLAGWIKKGWKTADKKPVKNQALWQRFDAARNALIARGVSVDIQWVRGHNGDEGNERADRLANRGVDAAKKLPAGEKTVSAQRGAI